MVATYKQVKDWAKTLPPGALECRAAGKHPWIGRRQEYQRGYGYYSVTRYCANGCGCVQHEEIDTLGARMGQPWIDYPVPGEGEVGYLSPLGRITGTGRNAVRKALIELSHIPTAITDRPPRFKGTYAGAKMAKGRKRA